MTFRTSEVCEGITSDMTKADVAKIFVACLERLASDGREIFEAMQIETASMEDGAKGEAESWMAELFPEEE